MLRRACLSTCLAVVLAFGLVAALQVSPQCARADTSVTPPESAGGSIAPGQALSAPFPRLSIWYPDPWRQPLAEIARYDYVIFYQGDGAFVPGVKALNPDLIALTKANTCLIRYNASQGPEGADNQQLAQIPAQWLLTQVGGRLEQGISATDTVIHLDRVSLVSGGTTHLLFVPGDSFVVDDEIAYVQAVDTAANTLTVRRGRGKPATQHGAGARVAATISSWPGMLVLDASTLCPAVTIGAAAGPETWASFKARQVAQLLSDPAWDGVMLDCCDGGKSWLIGASMARTIDPDRSNTLVPDYRAFDAAWNTGMRDLQAQVRELVGRSKVVVGNNSVPNFASLNGNNFEAFPDDTGRWHGTTPWDQMVLGPSGSSYFEWMANAQQPNLTTITTYDDDGGPSASTSGPHVGAATDPSSVANYRKMRFGLCTSLLNDGFFSYEVSTDGQAALGLLWFDEYDNAGAGPGYLGQPLGTPHRVVEQLSTADSVGGGGFDTALDLAQWRMLLSSGHSASIRLDTTERQVGEGSARIDIGMTSGSDFRIQLLQKPIAVAQGADYTLSFWAKADRVRPISVAVQNNNDPWNAWLNFGQTEASTTWRHYVLSATANGSDSSAGLYLKLGQASGSVWLDDVSLQRGSLAGWRRDFEGGVVIVNPSSSSLTVPLGGVYRKIKGTQAAAVNDGSLVSRVTLPARDGLILLRPTMSTLAAATQAASQLEAEWSLCSSRASVARAHYARDVRRTTGAPRTRALRARIAWHDGSLAARTARASVAAWYGSLASGDVATARSLADAAGLAAARALRFISRAWRRGHAKGTRATAARASARTGWDKLLTARQALALLPDVQHELP